MSKRFVIIGAGNGGQSLAGDLVLNGTEVTAIYDKNPNMVDPIAEQGGIKMSGPVIQGFAPIPLATTDTKTALEAGDVFLITITSNFHRTLAKEIAPYVKPEQTFLLIPGYVGSSVSFAQELQKAGVETLPLIGETLSLPYATRLLAPAHAGIKIKKFELPMAAFPATRNQELYNIINPAMKQTILFNDTMEIGFNNPNPMTHTVYYLFNLGKVESPESKTGDFHAWGTPIVDRIRDSVDAERVALAKALGIRPLTYKEFKELSYRGNHYKPIKQEIESLPDTSSQTPNRYIDEDIPMGLAVYQSFGKLLGVPTPTIDVVVSMANLVRQRDLREEGISVEKLGFTEMTAEEIMNYVRG